MRRHRQPTNSFTGAITIRRLRSDEHDHEALATLAGRDSSEPLEGVVLIAEVEGRMLAATSLANGRTIADPFSRTEELRSLLDLRARQLRHRARPVRRPLRADQRRARASLAGSPPGGGGRLLELSR